MRTIYLLSASALVIVLLITGCAKINKTNNDRMGLKETDRYYSDMSEKEGRNAAFIAMFDSSGVMLRENSMPVEGIAAIRNQLLMHSDTSYTLKWEPLFADSSGTLGYTYGTWTLTSSTLKEFLGEGTYVTIWKKDRNGHWKATLDTGNDGLKKN